MDGAVVVQPRRVAHGVLSFSAAVVDLLLRRGIDCAVDYRYRQSDPRVAASVSIVSRKGAKKTQRNDLV